MYCCMGMRHRGGLGSSCVAQVAQAVFTDIFILLLLLLLLLLPGLWFVTRRYDQFGFSPDLQQSDSGSSC